jgi:hypothetical protein
MEFLTHHLSELPLTETSLVVMGHWWTVGVCPIPDLSKLVDQPPVKRVPMATGTLEICNQVGPFLEQGITEPGATQRLAEESSSSIEVEIHAPGFRAGGKGCQHMLMNLDVVLDDNEGMTVRPHLRQEFPVGGN